MLNKIKRADQKGFTIIEVMIVLAIAGLIILIVLLAVPALQRNGRNTAIKNDASAVVAGVAEFSSNNDGSIPNAANSANTTGTVSLNNASGVATNAKIQGSTGYVDQDGAAAVTPAASTITVAFGAKCPTTVPATGAVAITANVRGTAVLFATETPGGLQNRCVDA